MNRSRNAFETKLLFTFGILLLTVGLAYGQDSAPASDEKKAKHVITDEDISSGATSAGNSQTSTAADSQRDNGAKPDATAASDPAGATDAVSAEEEMSKHQAGGPVPNESPKDAIKRLEREEGELRAKLDELRQKAETETSDNRRRMWLEAVDHQQVTLQQMSEERTKLQKSENEKAAAGNADSSSTPDQSGTGTAPQ